MNLYKTAWNYVHFVLVLHCYRIVKYGIKLYPEGVASAYVCYSIISLLSYPIVCHNEFQLLILMTSVENIIFLGDLNLPGVGSLYPRSARTLDIMYFCWCYSCSVFKIKTSPTVRDWQVLRTDTFFRISFLFDVYASPYTLQDQQLFLP